MISNRRGALKSVLALAGLGFMSRHAAADAGLRTMDGETTTLESQLVADRWNLVMIWATNCHVCMEETPRLSDLYDEEMDGKLTLLGVSIDGLDATDAVTAYRANHNMRFPTLLGDFLVVAEQYARLSQEELRGTPTFMLFDPDGQLAAVNPGPVRPEAVREFIEKRSDA